MTTDLRARALTLVGLAALGVGLAVVGTTVGTTNPLTNAGSSASFVVSDQNVTFERGDQQATVVDDMTGVDHVEIERQGNGVFRVNATATRVVSARERRRAKAIARNNATVERMLAKVERYELTVEPIRKLTVDDVHSVNATLQNSTTSAGEAHAGDYTFTVSVENQSTSTFASENRTGSVSVDREPSYVENAVSVRIGDPTGADIYYAVTVDLENGTVVDVTDWSTLRGD